MTTKHLEGVSFAEFARIQGYTRSYVSQLKTANRLVLALDKKRVLVTESIAKIKATSDPAKWATEIRHEEERKKKIARASSNSMAEREPALPTAEIDSIQNSQLDLPACKDSLHTPEIDTIQNSQLDLESTDADTLFRNSRAIKEKNLALQAAAERDLFTGTLVRRSDVERGIFEVVRQMRDGLINVSRRIAAEVAGLSDAGECEKAIDREHRLLLTALSRGFAEKIKSSDQVTT